MNRAGQHQECISCGTFYHHEERETCRKCYRAIARTYRAKLAVLDGVKEFDKSTLSRQYGVSSRCGIELGRVLPGPILLDFPVYNSQCECGVVVSNPRYTQCARCRLDDTVKAYCRPCSRWVVASNFGQVRCKSCETFEQ